LDVKVIQISHHEAGGDEVLLYLASTWGGVGACRGDCRGAEFGAQKVDLGVEARPLGKEPGVTALCVFHWCTQGILEVREGLLRGDHIAVWLLNHRGARTFLFLVRDVDKRIFKLIFLSRLNLRHLVLRHIEILKRYRV
jgi:hypothetical protein